MPYSNTNELPDSVKNVLPVHAHEIFKEAFNSAYDQYADPKERRSKADDLEETAFKVAWNAVKSTYEKGPDEKWHSKAKGDN